MLFIESGKNVGGFLLSLQQERRRGAEEFANV